MSEWVDIRDTYIADVVAGKTFAEVGGLWGTVNEKISVAHKHGATSLTMVDVTTPGTELWQRFDERMKELGVPAYQSISGDICDVAFQDTCGPFDVVHCSGVLYHHPNPMLMIEALRKITRQYLILTSAITQEMIENEAGTYRLPPSGIICVPALNDHEHAVLGTYWQSFGVTIYDITKRPFDNFGSWWFLPTATSFEAMCRAAGFVVGDSALTWNGNALILKLHLP